MYYYTVDVALDSPHQIVRSQSSTEEKSALEFFKAVLKQGGADGYPFVSLTLNVRLAQNTGNARFDRDRAPRNKGLRRNPIDLDPDMDEQQQGDQQEEQDEEEEEENNEDGELDYDLSPPSRRRRGRGRGGDGGGGGGGGKKVAQKRDIPDDLFDDDEYTRRYQSSSNTSKKRIRAVAGVKQRASAGKNVQQDEEEEADDSPAPSKQIREKEQDDDMRDIIAGMSTNKNTRNAPRSPPPSASISVVRNAEHMQKDLYAIRQMAIDIGALQRQNAAGNEIVALAKVLCSTIETHVNTYYSHGENKGTSYRAIIGVLAESNAILDKYTPVVVGRPNIVVASSSSPPQSVLPSAPSRITTTAAATINIHEAETQLPVLEKDDGEKDTVNNNKKD